MTVQHINSAYDGDSVSDRSLRKSEKQCPHCGSTKVVKSKALGSDVLVVSLLPRRPFRCLNCYHRFWHYQAWFADTRRQMSFALIIVLAVIASAWWWLQPVSTENDQASQAPKQARVQRTKLVEVSGFQPPLSANQYAEALVKAGVSQTRIATGLADAQEKAQTQIEKSIASKLAQQERTPAVLRAPSRETTLSLEQRVLRTLEQWRAAWERGDAERYLEFYSDQFEPQNGVSLNRWRELRRNRVTPVKNIQIELSNIVISPNPKTAEVEVTFMQNYRSENLKEISQKQLKLSKIANQWYIVRELEL